MLLILDVLRPGAPTARLTRRYAHRTVFVRRHIMLLHPSVETVRFTNVHILRAQIDPRIHRNSIACRHSSATYLPHALEPFELLVCRNTRQNPDPRYQRRIDPYNASLLCFRDGTLVTVVLAARTT